MKVIKKIPYAILGLLLYLLYVADGTTRALSMSRSPSFKEFCEQHIPVDVRDYELIKIALIKALFIFVVFLIWLMI